MKNRFKAISVILSLTLLINLFINTYEVKASTPLLGGPTSIFPWFDWSIEALKEVGLIFDPERVNNIPSVQDLKDAIEENDPEAEVSATDDGINEYINNNITTDNSNNSITYNDNSKFVLNYIGDYLKESNRYYVGYSLDLSLYSKAAWWTDDLESIISQYSDNYYIFAGADGGIYSQWWYYLFDKSKFAPVWRSNLDSNLTSRYGVDFYNTKTFDMTAPEGGCYYFNRSWNGSIGTIAETTPQAIYNSVRFFQLFVNNRKFVSSEFGLPLQNNYIFVTNNKTEAITIYSSQSLLASYGRGYAPYYYNNDVFNDFSSSSGDYTVSTDNRNYVTYGDVTTYIDDHHSETGSYPSIPEIDIWIEEQPIPTPNPTPTPNPNNPNSGNGGSATASANNEGINITVNNNHTINFGGSSLSGNTVSGNGSGENGSGGIFDFLGQIGKTIGNFVKNIGQVLADIVTGLGEVVSSLLESIPTIFGDFLGALIGWLPTELQALITLSITAMILVGLIKLFRG